LKTARQEKIAEEIRREVSTMLYFDLQDPRLLGVSVTGVKMTPDLRVARIYFNIPGKPEKSKEVMSGFKSSSGMMKRLLSQRISLKFMPNFEFFYDESLELQDKIDLLFEEVESKKK